MKTNFKSLALNISKLHKTEPKLKLSAAKECILILNQLVENKHSKNFNELFGLLAVIISNYKDEDLSKFNEICKKHLLSKTSTNPIKFIKDLRKSGFSALPKIDISVLLKD